MIKKIFLTFLILGVYNSFGAAGAAGAAVDAEAQQAARIQTAYDRVLSFDEKVEYSPFNKSKLPVYTYAALRDALWLDDASVAAAKASGANGSIGESRLLYVEDVAVDLDILERLDVTHGEASPLNYDEPLKRVYARIGEIAQEAARKEGLILPAGNMNKQVSRQLQFLVYRGIPSGDWFAKGFGQKITNMYRR